MNENEAAEVGRGQAGQGLWAQTLDFSLRALLEEPLKGSKTDRHGIAAPPCPFQALVIHPVCQGHGA